VPARILQAGSSYTPDLIQVFVTWPCGKKRAPFQSDALCLSPSQIFFGEPAQDGRKRRMRPFYPRKGDVGSEATVLPWNPVRGERRLYSVMEVGACSLVLYIRPDHAGRSGIIRPDALYLKFECRKSDGAEGGDDGIQRRGIDLSNKLQSDMGTVGVHKSKFCFRCRQNLLTFFDTFSDRRGQINSNKNSHHQTE
jgi:hypothetical protein